MVSRKGYWDMINEHIVKGDLEYLESEEVRKQREDLKKNWLGKDELYQFEIAQMQKQIQNLYIRIKELNETIRELKNEKTN